ncbi:hypothetical protein CHELA1G11_30050 [Hyphomicrobiales bacterium]|nr:hypothetical protein CHELA1G11_30050 [Hyphomicrobiales bacterium]
MTGGAPRIAACLPLKVGRLFSCQVAVRRESSFVLNLRPHRKLTPVSARHHARRSVVTP